MSPNSTPPSPSLTLLPLIPILLLTSPSPPYSPSSPPPFPPPTYHSQHIPPLLTTLHASALLPILSSAPPLVTHAAVLFTSARGASAFAQALRSPLLPQGAGKALRGVRMPLFAVGPGTGGRVRREIVGSSSDEVGGEERGDDGEGCGGDREKGVKMSRCWVQGEESGSGEVLAREVGQALGPGKSVLWVAGEKRRQKVKETLEAAGVLVEVCVAYGTAVDPGFGTRFADALRETDGSLVRWVVAYSVQGGREMLARLGWLGEEGNGKVQAERLVGRSTFVACVGPTTREAFAAEFGFRVDVCAERPSADSVKEGIERFMKEREIWRRE